MSLFDVSPIAQAGATAQAPLAERMRPRTLDEYTGQMHLLGEGKPLRLAVERDQAKSGDGTQASSMIFWGPPGVGKTTLAKIIARATGANFVEFSAVLSGIKEIKQVMVEAERAAGFGSRTILFVDEIHRFNKAQQDAFLPYVERGTIRLIGATTENPSFEINAALLSRCRVYTLVALTEERRWCLLLETGAGGCGARPRRRWRLGTDADALVTIAAYSERRCPHCAERAGGGGAYGRGSGRARPSPRLSRRRRCSGGFCCTTRRGEQHYDLISALHKSVRNSDADAALYWLGRMLEAGEDPMYVARRVVRMAVEDVGLAAPEALNLCLSARDAMHFLGHAGRRSGAGAGGGLPGAGTEVECGLHGLRGGRRRTSRRPRPSRCRCICETHRRS